MVPSLSEIILFLFILVCIFGLGKLGDMSEAIGEMRARKKLGDEAIDITPDTQRAEHADEPKPGTREQPVDEAVVDEESSNERPET